MSSSNALLRTGAAVAMLFAVAFFGPAQAEPIGNTGLSPQQCYKKDSGCTQFCGEVAGDLRYECFGICDRMLDRCLTTGDWSDSLTASPGDDPSTDSPTRGDRVDQFSSTLLELAMSQADSDSDGVVSEREIEVVKSKVHKSLVSPEKPKRN